MTILVLTALFIAGLIALRIGLRGRRIDDHPLCRRCGFDLTGKPAESWACAECGADLSVAKAVKIGHRRRLMGWVAGGLILVFAAIGTVCLDLRQNASTFHWIQYMPVKWLLYEGQYGNVALSKDSANELLRRAKSGSLTNRQSRAAIDVALSIQGDMRKPWNHGWGDFLYTERYKKQMTDGQWALFIRQSPAGSLRLRVRPRVRLGDPLPYQIEFSNSARSTLWGALQQKLDGTVTLLDFPGQPLLQFAGEELGSVGGTGCISFVANPSGLPTNISSGVHHVKIEGVLHIFEDWNGYTTSMQSVQIGLTDDFLLLPSTQPSSRAVKNPAVADAIRRGMTIRLRARLKPNSFRDSMVTVNSSPVPLSFKIYALIKAKEYLLGGIACPANGGRASWGMDYQTDPVPFNLLFASSQPVASQRPLVTIIFRPDPGPAINSTDVFDYWDGTIELKDVPVVP